MVWREYSKSGKRPIDIPGDPASVYKKEWKGMGDWIGTGYIAHQKRKYATYDVAKKFCQSHGIMSGTLRKNGWRAYCKNNVLPKEMTTRPDHAYKLDGTWNGWGDFTGTGKKPDQIKARNYLTFKEAQPIYKKLAKQYHLDGYSDWERFAKTHKKLLEELRLPASPWQTYTGEKVLRMMKK